MPPKSVERHHNLRCAGGEVNGREAPVAVIARRGRGRRNALFGPKPFSRDLRESPMPRTQTGWKSPAAANPDTRQVERSAAKPIGIETRLQLGTGSARDNTNVLSEASWAIAGTLVGGVDCRSPTDDLPSTSVSMASVDHRVDIACLFGIKFGAFEARKRRRRWDSSDAKTGYQPFLQAAAHAIQDALTSGAPATRRQPEVQR